VNQVAAELGLEPAAIDVRGPLTRLGLDSMTAVILSGDLEEWLGVPLAPGLLGEYGTIELLARHLGGNAVAPTPSSVRGQAAAERARLQTRPSSPARPWVPRVVAALTRLLTRIEIQGEERFPAAGPLILAMNHLHIIDAPLVSGFVPAGTAFFVSEHMRKFPLAGWYLRQLGQPVYVNRGEADREAIAQALAVLRGGGLLVMAPEGKISKTGGLLRGHTGLAHLATESGAAILPIVICGQEKAWHYWLTLRRVPVRVCVGDAMHLPEGRASLRQLEGYTEQLMLTLAGLLPPRYRGVYGAAVAGLDGAAPAHDPVTQ
jgi:1-acyl-sn-glycerol-3-phosphate acyltransferase